MKAFYMGKKGFRYNKTNPYEEGEWEHKEYERGYNTAYFENLKWLENKSRKRSERLRKKEESYAT